MGNGFFGLFTNNDNNEKNEKDIKDKELIVKISRCPQNHLCPAVRACPVGALKQNGYSAPTVTDSCIKCGKCVKVCPMRAIALQ